MPGSYIISILQSFFYADDTNYGIHSSSSGNNTSTFRARIWKYMNLNHTKCIHLRLNDLERITYMNGTEVPMEQEAIYLGGKKPFRAAATGKKSHTESLTLGTRWRNLIYSGKRHLYRSNGESEFSMQSSSPSYFTVWNQSHSRSRTATD